MMVKLLGKLVKALQVNKNLLDMLKEVSDRENELSLEMFNKFKCFNSPGTLMEYHIIRQFHWATKAKLSSRAVKM